MVIIKDYIITCDFDRQILTTKSYFTEIYDEYFLLQFWFWNEIEKLFVKNFARIAAQFASLDITIQSKTQIKIWHVNVHSGLTVWPEKIAKFL